MITSSEGTSDAIMSIYSDSTVTDFPARKIIHRKLSFGSSIPVDYLIIGGGGSSGGARPGGGGGGGFLNASNYMVTLNQPIPVVVGAGGRIENITGCSVVGKNGENSSFDGIVAIGGGRGGWSYQ